MHFVQRLIGAIALAFALAAPAGAQYFARYDVTFDSPPTCDASALAGIATGSFSSNLPASPNNQYTSYSINGGAPITELNSGPPGLSSFPLTASTLYIPLPVSTPPPYTLTALGFPAINGQPTGLGVRLEGVCNADGSATITFVNDVPAPSFAVPALQSTALVALGVLMGLVALVQLRRSRGRGAEGRG